MNATIWHNPACGTSRKTLAILQETPANGLLFPNLIIANPKFGAKFDAAVLAEVPKANEKT